MAQPQTAKTIALAGHLSPAARGPGSQATQIEQSRAVAEVQAMVIVAQRCPRSISGAIDAIQESCAQMGLAEVAFFKFSRGGSPVTGPSIHLATELARCWGNINYGIKELSRDDEKHESEMVAYSWDVQTNARSETSFIVPHKRDRKDGAALLIDMRDIYENNANMGARRLREMIFRSIPSHILSMAEDACRATLEKGEGTEPVAVRIAKTLKAFAEIGVSRERIETKLGISADAMTPVDLANLRISYQSIKRAEVTAEDEFPTVAAIALAAELGAKLSEKAANDTKAKDKAAGDAVGGEA